LDVRGGRVARANEQLHWLVGIKVAINLDDPKAPSIERLNDAVAMLRGEGREADASNLLEAAYARAIALGQFESVYFNGLARLAFERGDTKLALVWLQSMIELTVPENKEQTAASLMAMPLIAAHAESQPQSEDVQFDQMIALRLAAETAGEFGAFAAALNYRQQLLTASPADEENRIELIRLLAVTGKKDEALQSLAATIADRDASRELRQQAVGLKPEIAGSAPAVVEDDALEQMVAAYLKQNQPRAALQVAEGIPAFQSNNNSETSPQPSPGRYQTLRERAQTQKLATHINLLSLLSVAAEQIGDLNRAVELERLRLVLDRNATQARLDHLQQLQRAYTRKTFFVVDQKLTADYTE
jgi:DNA-binding SARP family transcriptional activator